MSTLPDLPFNTAQKIDITYLQLDYDNPRLVDITDRTKEAFIKKFIKSSDLKELINSMAENGYMDIEPLIVVLDRDKYTVLEGNRRLAALMILRDASLAKECNIDIPDIDDSKKSTFYNEITVYRVNNREESRAFIGFKHINGPHKWDSFAKAKYATQWYLDARDSGITVEDISRQIGDSNETITKMIKGYLILEQAKNNSLYDLEDRVVRRFSFSHLYTALMRTEYCDFLGLTKEWRTGPPTKDGVKPEKFDNLRKVLIWIYGSRSEEHTPKIKTQNPDLAKLGKIIVNTEARAALEAGQSLEEAFLKLSKGSEIFSLELTKADRALSNAMSNLYSYEGGLYNMIERVKKQADMIYKVAKNIEDNN